MLSSQVDSSSLHPTAQPLINKRFNHALFLTVINGSNADYLLQIDRSSLPSPVSATAQPETSAKPHRIDLLSDTAFGRRAFRFKPSGQDG